MMAVSARAAGNRMERGKEKRGEDFSGGGNEAALSEAVSARESSGDAGVLRRSERSVLEASTGEAAVEHAKKRAGPG
jgi:hypothetical protein